MSTTLSNGYKIPSVGERGTWWNDLADNFQRLNDHTHDGEDSELLSSSAIDKGVGGIASANWVAVPTKLGLYYQDVTMPAGFTTVNLSVKIFVDGGTYDGYEVVPSIHIINTSTYRIYCNNNTLTLKAIYA